VIHELTFTITVAQRRRAIWQWLWSANPWFPAFALVLALSALGLVFSSGGLRVLFALVFGAVAGYFTLFAYSALRPRPDRGEVHVTIDDSGLSWHGEFGATSVPWSSLQRLDLCRDYVFATLRGEPVALPRTALSEAALGCLIEHTVAAGGAVRGVKRESGLPAERSG
jgi:hypothetical protein